jgi:hypothetical protein
MVVAEEGCAARAGPAGGGRTAGFSSRRPHRLRGADLSSGNLDDVSDRLRSLQVRTNVSQVRSLSDNASGAVYGEAHISRHGQPGLRLAVWRAVWPMCRLNPVMAAKYQAMTQAGAAERAACRCAAGQGPGRVRRLAAALDLLHGHPRHRLGPRRRRRCRQQPGRPGGGCLTSASIPHPPRVPETFLPDEGESEPAWPSGTNPA